MEKEIENNVNNNGIEKFSFLSESNYLKSNSLNLEDKLKRIKKTLAIAGYKMPLDYDALIIYLNECNNVHYCIGSYI